MLLCPQVERDRGEFVDQGIGQAVLREVHGLYIGAASVAALDPHVRKLFSREDRESGLVLLATGGTHDAAEFPLGETESANQVAAGAVALLAEHAETWLAIAEWAQRMSIALELQGSA